MKSIWNISGIRNLAVALAAGLVLAVGYSPAARADQCGGADGVGTYDELIAAGSCTIGDKTFSNFFLLPPSFDAADVSFSIINGAGGFWGFTFQFNITAVGPGDSVDFALGYIVSCTDGSACIDSIHAAMTGGVTGTGGSATVAETYTSPNNGPAGGFILSSTPSSASHFDASFSPVVSLTITKDINVTCGRNASSDCFATISLVTNTVDQVTVPEPGTLALLAAGLLGLGWVGRRRQDRS